MFSTDLVVTDEPIKTQQWIQERFQAYFDMLAEQTYTTPLIPGQTLNGLNLPPAMLDRIFFKNYEDFLALKPTNAKANKSIDWSKLGGSPIDRKPGQAFPPHSL